MSTNDTTNTQPGIEVLDGLMVGASSAGIALLRQGGADEDLIRYAERALRRGPGA